MEIQFPVDANLAVGPIPDMYGHGPVTVIQERTETEEPQSDTASLFVCLDCGYTAHDNRLLAHENCDRKRNPITQTWREFLADEDADTLPHAAPDEGWPIED